MKTALILMLIPFAFVQAATVNLKPVDSEKLSILISKLPLKARTKKTSKISGEPCGLRISSAFKSDALTLNCSSDYYNKALYQTTGRCEVLIDMSHKNVSQQNNEVRVVVNNEADVEALYQTIPYGNPDKGYWGWERDYGRNFEGYKAPLFHFFVKCSKSQCVFTFSAYNIVQ